MNTMIIPLKAFKAVDLYKVQDVYFEFSHEKHPSGEIVVDNIELIK